ncbi:cobalt ABC transporter, inner membrane subunit CbiQ [Desulfofarcimen acetoxidans DSM 771]|jgi:cobalt/nickel transport system permease protein|uniref:Cobalt ABC transporter, inner membrane subunit CbiQ n=1 Tax=Desulfofarcimen acetoxidans (strain ATCC 49208 / DSM 771 / KCTC 5769 / VKM B-1644 / 5575) TaxID=485916 RepID=C8VWS8_DESAS|nr:cobalt ECF transporter T component CbiQ [Desulfofarcimen acetoxidans]ACV64442.1 cobalt ABC transporter, inner membrane subunit CbiQ [Desulfofarcimen acetoxidans DSM 771]
MFSIDSYAYSNKLRKVHPAEKCAFAMVTLIICLAASSLLTSLAVLLIMSAAVVGYAGIPFRVFAGFMSLPVSFLLVGVLTIAVTVSREPGVYLWGLSFWGFNLGITAAGVAAAVILLFKSLGAVSCLYFLSLTTPMIDIIYVLRKMKVPALFIELMTLIYRFIFVLAETAEKIYTSQSSRLGYAGVNVSFSSLGELASTLFIKSFHRSQMLFQALSSRCYTGGLNVLDNYYEFSIKNMLFIAALDLGIAALSLYSGGGQL